MNFNNHNAVVALDEIVRQLREQHEQWHLNYQTQVRFIGDQHGSLNLPSPNDTSFEHLVKPIRAEYRSQRSIVSLELEAAIQDRIGQIDGAVAKQELTWIDESRTELMHRIKTLSADLVRLTTNPRCSSYKQWQIALYILGLGEYMLMAYVFLHFGGNYLMSGLIGFFFGVAQITSVQKGVEQLKEISDRTVFKRWFRIGIVISLIWCCVIGYIRFYTSEHQNSVEAIALAMINLAFLTATALTVFLHFPTKAELEQIKVREQVSNALENTKTQLREANTRREALLKEVEECQKFQERVKHKESFLHDFIGNNFQSSIGAYIIEAIIKRADKNQAICLQNELLPL